MPSTSSPSGRAGRKWYARADLFLTVAVAATLCSATYCFSIWHNGRNAPEKIVFGPTPFVAVAVSGTGVTLCGGRGSAAELDFETHHSAEKAGLSVSSSSAPATVAGRRSLRAAATVPMDAERREPWLGVDGELASGGSGRARTAGKVGARVDGGDKLRSLAHDGGVRT